uniref:VWFA domain-containing protein n=1 Tax=Globodera pallida TaxID=36090 RepID=A0A183C3D1_GLOPA
MKPPRFPSGRVFSELSSPPAHPEKLRLEVKEGGKGAKEAYLALNKEFRKKEERRRAFGVVARPQIHCPSLDVLFVIDSSGSVQRVYDVQKRWLEEILCQIQLEEPEKGPRVALIQFAGAELQKTEWGWDRFRNSEQMMDAFHQVRHLTGTTYIGRALQQAALLLERRRRPVPAFVVLLSDGFSQDDAVQYSDQKQRETTNSSSSSLYSSDQCVQRTVPISVHSSPSAASSLLSSSNSINSNSNSSSNPNEQQPSSPASLVSSSTSNNTNGLQTSKSTALKAAETIQRLRQQLPQGRAKPQSVDFGKALSSPLDTNPRLKSPPGTAPLVQSARSFWNSVHSNSSSSSANNVPQHPIGTTPLHQQQFNRFRQRFQQQQSVDSLSSTASSDQSVTETTKYPQSPTINPNRLHHRRQQHQLNLQFKHHHSKVEKCMSITATNTVKDSDTAMTIMFDDDSKNDTLSAAGVPSLQQSVANVAATNSASESASCSSVTPSPSPSPIVASSVTLNSSPFVTVRKQPHCQQSTPPTQPISSRESEAERKAKSRLKRSTRRSTQGVTLEQLGEVSMRNHAPKHHGRAENGKEQQKQRTATIGRLGSDNSLELSNNKLTPNDLQPPPASPCSSTSSSSAYLTAASHRVVDQQSQKVQQQQQNSTMPSSTASLIDELDKYRQLYERERDESERLRTERRMFERRIVALEYELEKSQQMQTDTEKLKNENIALVRVLAKLSK